MSTLSTVTTSMGMSMLHSSASAPLAPRTCWPMSTAAMSPLACRTPMAARCFFTFSSSTNL
eukprot:5359540-Lingulodinium_polyedra.AAC.1